MWHNLLRDSVYWDKSLCELHIWSAQRGNSLPVWDANISCLAYHLLSVLILYVPIFQGRLSDHITYVIWYAIYCFCIHTNRYVSSMYEQILLYCQTLVHCVFFVFDLRTTPSHSNLMSQNTRIHSCRKHKATVFEWWRGPIQANCLLTYTLWKVLNSET